MKWLGILTALIGWSPTMFGVPSLIAVPIAFWLWLGIEYLTHVRWEAAVSRLEYDRNMEWLRAPPVARVSLHHAVDDMIY